MIVHRSPSATARARRSCATSTSSWRRARSSPWRAPTAWASRRCCGSSRASRRRRAGASRAAAGLRTGYAPEGFAAVAGLTGQRLAAPAGVGPRAGRRRRGRRRRARRAAASARWPRSRTASASAWPSRRRWRASPTSSSSTSPPAGLDDAARAALDGLLTAAPRAAARSWCAPTTSGCPAATRRLRVRDGGRAVGRGRGGRAADARGRGGRRARATARRGVVDVAHGRGRRAGSRWSTRRTATRSWPPSLARRAPSVREVGPA